LAVSEEHLFVYDEKKLVLFNLKKKLKEIEWNDNVGGIIVDMCWASKHEVFLILSIHSVYTYDPQKPSQWPAKIEQIQPLDRSHVLSSIATYHTKDVYINYHKGVHIDQYHCGENSRWKLEQRFSKEECCDLTTDLGIRDIRCDQFYICLSVMQQNLMWRIDIRNYKMGLLRRGIQMDRGENQHKFFSMLTPLYDNRWLFMNWFTNCLWLIDEHGEPKQLDTKIKNIRNCCLSANNHEYFVIRTEKKGELKVYKT